MKQLKNKIIHTNLTEKQLAHQKATDCERYIKTFYFEKYNVEFQIILN